METKTIVEIAFEDGKQEGRKEVVEWIEKHGYVVCSNFHTALPWQSRLKKWGIDKLCPQCGTHLANEKKVFANDRLFTEHSCKNPKINH